MRHRGRAIWPLNRAISECRIPPPHTPACLDLVGWLFPSPAPLAPPVVAAYDAAPINQGGVVLMRDWNKPGAVAVYDAAIKPPGVVLMRDHENPELD